MPFLQESLQLSHSTRTADIKVFTSQTLKFIQKQMEKYVSITTTKSHDNHEKINSWVSFSFPYEYGVPLGSPLGRWTSELESIGIQKEITIAQSLKGTSSTSGFNEAFLSKVIILNSGPIMLYG